MEHPSPAYPFEPRTIDVFDSTISYLDEGAGEPVVFLHGNPTWSYLWRNVIPEIAPRRRCIAPDLVGFGRSGKPDIAYRFVDHVRYLDAFLDALALEPFTLVVQDWGSALGFHFARRFPERVKALAFMEFIWPMPSWDDFAEVGRPLFQGFRSAEAGWRLAAIENKFIELALPGAVARGLGLDEMAHYRAPFPDPESRLPVWRFPNELPIAGEPADVFALATAWHDWLMTTHHPKLLFYANPGSLISHERALSYRDTLPNCESVFLGKGIHFLQEDHPQRIGREVA